MEAKNIFRMRFVTAVLAVVFFSGSAGADPNEWVIFQLTDN